jgi:hypothetical protein
MIGMPGGSYLVLLLSNPTHIARMARKITNAGGELALLLAATDLRDERPGALGGPLLTDGLGALP